MRVSDTILIAFSSLAIHMRQDDDFIPVSV
jgi:hypothetical protein